VFPLYSVPATSPGPATIQSVAVATRRAIDYQRTDDQNRVLTPWNCLDARLRGVVEAREALARREVGARPALRQALVDLASLAEQCADDLS
jgi:hypothetical protein